MYIKCVIRAKSWIAVLAFGLLFTSTSAIAQNSLATTITLTVTGGPHEGTYQATSEEVTCSYGLAGEDAWGNQYSIDTTDPKTFSSLQVIVPNASDTGSGTSQFVTTVSFGQLFGSGVSYTIDSRNDGGFSGGKGEGAVAIEDNGDSAVVMITGTTKEGVGIKVNLQCHQVMRFASSYREDDLVPNGSLSLRIGGENYSLETTDDEAGCEQGFYEEGDLYYGYYNEESYSETGEGLFDLEFLAYDLQAARQGSPDFYLSINGQTYYLDTTSDDGSGTVRVQQNGDIFIITIEAMDKETLIQATIECQAAAY